MLLQVMSCDLDFGPQDYSSSVCEILALGLETFAKNLGLALKTWGAVV